MTLIKTYLNFLLREKKILYQSILAGLAYGVFYYAAIGYMRFEAHEFSIITIPNWSNMTFKTRAPFLWEPTIRLYSGLGITFDFSFMNILLTCLLIVLAFLNISLLITSIKMPKICNLKSKGGRIMALLPAFLSGFACCAPTFVIVWVSIFGGVATSFLAFARWAIPLSLVMLTLGAWRGLRLLNINETDR
ncbi:MULTISPECIES: hypothetical protein [unclassified Fusibacter]|uniref:hypothetical protein n=1 Tax=unclassified Fusibacter TaxID=2624464 RepID=UPI00101074CB|nr:MULTISPECIES: hypothetical protein [unclassified Fusibacter]MCK8060252.1 hypothetical protein [Fusibacter sp. A2]NPE20460.1 hypothetical protein [Fusibacter sp. A1]RXV63665.1 hypothetical protein DWB64_01420 [Fusibacter sp. A1]